MKFIWLLSIAFLLAACAPTAQPTPEAAAPTPTGAFDFSGVHLRLHNAGGRDLDDVTLTVGSQAAEFGALSAGVVSEYVTFTAVHTPPTLHATSDETIYEWTAETAAAEGLMAGGQFTLELTIENDKLLVGFLMENPILYDAQYYADEMGITLEEALARLDTQNDDAIGTLQTQLHANEADTFAGLWIQHEPEYRIVVAFTRDGEEAIQKYVTEGSELAQLIEVRQVQYSYAQLEADRQEAFRILNGLNLSAGGGVMVMDNRVVIDITDRAAFEAALAAADATLPESVVINTVYESVGENPPFDITPVPDVVMPQLKQRDVAFMEALLIGELVVEDGCLRVYSENERYLVIWQADYFLTDNNGVLEVLDETGTAVARVGEMIYMGGGDQRTVDNAELRQPVPEPCSSGPYWRMGQFLPEEYIPNVAADLPPTPPADGWETYTMADLNLAFNYPVDWFVHEAGKMLQITPNAQPLWSSIFDPNEPHGGPTFDLMHNLNRLMGPTPQAEVENLLQGYEGAEIEAIVPAAPLADRPDVVVGVYRFVVEQDEMVLLVGTAVNPIPDSPQPVIAMTGLVKPDELTKMQTIFTEIMRSLRSADS